MSPQLLRGLVVFCTAARYLSFKMAADQLCITPSAVSHQIKALEDTFGSPLFERRTRAIVLTGPGAALYSQVDPLVRALEGVTTDFFGHRREKRRVLRISLLPFFASEMLIPRLGDLSRTHASLDLRLETNSVGSEFPPGSDASILLLTGPSPNHHSQELFRLELVPACAPALLDGSDRLDPEAIKENVLIVHKSRPEAWADWFSSVGAPLKTQPKVIYLDDMFAVARAAEQGLGIALVPTPLIDAWFESGSLVRLSDAGLDTGDSYYFLHDSDAESDADVVALREWAVHTFAT